MADGQQTSFSHEPVMREEIVDVFAEVPPGTILDATVGGGGHSEALLGPAMMLMSLVSTATPRRFTRRHTASNTLDRDFERPCVDLTTSTKALPSMGSRHSAEQSSI